jgi:hypothetical protein
LIARVIYLNLKEILQKTVCARFVLKGEARLASAFGATFTGLLEKPYFKRDGKGCLHHKYHDGEREEVWPEQKICKRRWRSLRNYQLQSGGMLNAKFRHSGKV